MTIDNLLPALMGALVGGFITMIGWWVNYFLGRKKEIETQQRLARIHHIQLQIEELYAPVWSLIEQSKSVHAIACKRLPVRSDGLMDRSKFSQQDSEINQFFSETYFIPINAQISDILRKKVYLLKDGIMPASFFEFIEHQITNESLYRLWKEKGIDSSNTPGKGYPVKFGEDVKAILDDLRQQYNVEIAMISRTKK